jgi:hypothetical protein
MLVGNDATARLCSAKAPLEPFAFNPGPLGPEKHN